MHILGDAAIRNKVVRPCDLRNFQSGHTTKMGAHVKLTITNASQVQIGNMRYWYDNTEGIRNIRRMFNAKPLDNRTNAISDTMILRFHIAILKIELETTRTIN